MENIINLEMLVCDIILQMERPFKISQLFRAMSAKGIEDKNLILDVLDQLCDSGLVKYSEIDDDTWAYKSKVQLVNY